MNASGEAAKKLVMIQVEFHSRLSGIPSRASPAEEYNGSSTTKDHPLTNPVSYAG